MPQLIDLGNGVQLNVQDHGGSGPPLILAGGMGMPMAAWIFQTLQLKDDLRLITFDARGIGDTVDDGSQYSIHDLVTDILLLMDKLELERASILGYSLGGAVCQLLASEHPERVDKLLLLATVPLSPEMEVIQQGIQNVLGLPDHPSDEEFKELLPKLTEIAFNSKIFRWLLAKLMPLVMDDETIDGVIRQSRAMMGAVDLMYNNVLEGITAPTLIMHGTKDGLVPAIAAWAIRRRVSNSRLHWIHKGSHSCAMEKFWLVNRAIESYIKSPTAKVARTPLISVKATDTAPVWGSLGFAAGLILTVILAVLRWIRQERYK